MRFNFYDVLMNPFFLLFVTLFLGMWLGNLKCLGRMALGVGGPLFLALPISWGVYSLALSIPEGHAAFNAAQTLINDKVIPTDLTNVMLLLFVGAVGLLAAKDLGLVIKKYGLKFIALGLTITLLGAGLSYLSSYINPSTNTYSASGIYTGALTSSPGLGAALENAEKHALQRAEADPSITEEEKAEMVHRATSDVGTGYAIAYPFGMILVIVAMTLLPKLFRIDVKEELSRHREEMDKARQSGKIREITPVHFDIKSFALVCFLGYVLGSIEINLGPLGYFSLGSNGGVLIASIVLGYIGKIGPFCFRMDTKVLSSVKDLTLACYVGMIGLKYGYDVINAIVGNGLYFAVASIVVASICVLVGFLVGRYVFKINWIMLSGAICGGMTSTPGLGMALDSIGTDDPAAGYAATYPFALIGMVLFTIIMFTLP